MPRKPKPRPAAQKAGANERYYDGNVSVGIARTSVLVPVDRIPDLRAITLAWRKDAKLLLEADLPSADQILQIHSVSRTLGLPLPVTAFDTRATAAEWLLARETALGAVRPRIPQRRSPR